MTATTEPETADEGGASSCDLPEDQLAYVRVRWGQLAELEQKRIETLLSYLFLISSGAAAATLTYMGALAQASRPIPGEVSSAMGAFASAVITVGLLKARLFYSIRRVYSRWRKNVESFQDGAKSWDELLRGDREEAKEDYWVHVLVWVAFLLLAVGMWNGGSHLVGGKHGDKETINDNSSAAGASASAAVVRDQDRAQALRSRSVEADRGGSAERPPARQEEIGQGDSKGGKDKVAGAPAAAQPK